MASFVYAPQPLLPAITIDSDSPVSAHIEYMADGYLVARQATWTTDSPAPYIAIVVCLQRR